MTKVLLNRFDGGLAMSERPQTINEQSSSGGFDVYTDPFLLKKIDSMTVNETASGASVTAGECPVYDATKRASDGRIIGVGGTSASNTTFRFYKKDSSITGNWVQNSSTGNGIVNANAFAVLYKDVQYGYYVQTSESRLYRYDSDSASTLIGTTADAHTEVCPRPVVHSQDNILYMGSNKTISKFDGTTFTASAITLPYYITSMCEYGTYLAISCQTPEGGVIYLWGRDTSLTTLQDVIKVDNGKLQIIENLDGYLVAVSETPFDPYTASIGIVGTYKSVTVRMFIGGAMKIVKKTYLGLNENGSNQLLSHKKVIRDGSLLFSTKSNYLMRFGLNKQGQYVLSRDAAVVPATASPNLVSMYSFFVLGDYLFSSLRASSGSPSDGLLYRNNGLNGGTSEYFHQSYYVTTINPSMDPNDRIKDKQLKKVAVHFYSTSTTQGTITVKYSTDKGVNYTTAISQDFSSTTLPSKFYRFEADQDTSGEQFKTGIEFLFKIESTYQVDPIQFWYEYENTDSLIN
jgi:hypothetical protein